LSENRSTLPAEKIQPVGRIMKVLEAEDIVKLLRSEVAKAGGQLAWAKKVGVSRPVLNRVLNGRGSPTKKMIKALGLRVVYTDASE
jgi:DNA-binding phage protein